MPVIFPPIPPIPPVPPSPPDNLGREMNLRARRWAMFCHLAGFLVFGVLSAFLIVPLIKWMVKQGEHPFVDDQGKEAINFQATVLLSLVVTIVAPTPGLTLVLLVVDIVFMVTAARHAYDGHHYRYPYPLTIVRLMK